MQQAGLRESAASSFALTCTAHKVFIGRPIGVKHEQDERAGVLLHFVPPMGKVELATRSHRAISADTCEVVNRWL